MDVNRCASTLMGHLSAVATKDLNWLVILEVAMVNYQIIWQLNYYAVAGVIFHAYFT